MLSVISQNSELSSLRRQAVHWKQAASRLSILDNIVSTGAWHGIERNLGETLRKHLQKSIAKVLENANQLYDTIEFAVKQVDLRKFRKSVIDLREQYLKAEETLHFYSIAINSRINSNIAALLRACDILCLKSMEELLKPLGKNSPPVLTFIDKGVGASILKAGLRLWDSSISPVAAIKITQHNLFRPTAIIHETGHQVAHILGWNDELSDSLEKNLSRHPAVVANVFGSWSSEIAADAFGFVHTGFASIAALHDVVSGSSLSVFAYRAHDPHPICYVRVLMGIEMCRHFYGPGPWNDLEECFKNDYDINQMNFSSVPLIKMCVNALPDVAPIILKTKYRAFNGQSLTQIIDPEKVSPRSLEKLEYIAGPALLTSHAWIWKECIRILALIGYKIGTGKGDLNSYYKQQEQFMMQLGFAIEVN